MGESETEAEGQPEGKAQSSKAPKGKKRYLSRAEQQVNLYI